MELKLTKRDSRVAKLTTQIDTLFSKLSELNIQHPGGFDSKSHKNMLEIKSLLSNLRKDPFSFDKELASNEWQAMIISTSAMLDEHISDFPYYNIFKRVAFNDIPDDVLQLSLAIIKHPKFIYNFQYNDKKESVEFVSNIISLCNIKCSLDDVRRTFEDAYGNPTADSQYLRDLDEDRSTFRFKNVYSICDGCDHSLCAKSVLAFLLYVKENDSLDYYLELHDEPTGFFHFNWAPPNGLRTVSETVFKMAEQIVLHNKIGLDRFLTKNNRVNIFCGCNCTQIREAIDETSVAQFEKVSSWNSITRNVTHEIEDGVCDNMTCRKDYCPLVVAAYMYYLKMIGQEDKIEEDRKYYHEHVAEIIEQNKNAHEKRLLAADTSDAKQNLTKAFEVFENNTENLDLLIENIYSKIENNMFCVIEREDGVNVDPLIDTIITELLNCEKIKRPKLAKRNEDEEQRYGEAFLKSSLLNRVGWMATSMSSSEGLYNSAIFDNELCKDIVYVFDHLREVVNANREYMNAEKTPSFYELRQKQHRNLIAALTDLSPNKYIVLVGNKDDIDDFLSLDMRLKYIYNNMRIIVRNMSIDEMFDLYRKNLRGKVLDAVLADPTDAKMKFDTYISRNRVLIPFKNQELATYLSSYSNSRGAVVFPPDVYKRKTLDESLAEIVGLHAVKEKIREFEQFNEFRIKAQSSGLKIPHSNMHMLFTGNPGSGKTTIARIMAKMLYDIGILKENKLIEVERKDLIAEYIGQTAMKTASVIDKARGGVLFIDEAYSLTPKDPGRDYGPEAIATLVKSMEDYKDELVVIFAGYKEEMKRFVNSNPGIASRLGYTFDFPDYNAQELFDIFMIKMKSCGFVVEQNTQDEVMKVMKYFVDVKNIGNGRFVDKLIQATLVKHAKNGSNNIANIVEDDIPSIQEIIKIVFADESMIDPDLITEESIKKTAIHEIGHAYIRYKLYNKPNIKKITVNADGCGLLGCVEFNETQKFTYSKTDFINHIKVCLGGMASEEVFNGEFENGNSSDLAKATNFARDMVTRFGMSDLGLAQISKTDDALAAEVQKEINSILDTCYNSVKSMINQNKHEMQRLVDYLLEHKEIDEDEFLSVIKKYK